MGGPVGAEIGNLVGMGVESLADAIVSGIDLFEKKGPSEAEQGWCTYFNLHTLKSIGFLGGFDFHWI